MLRVAALVTFLIVSASALAGRLTPMPGQEIPPAGDITTNTLYYEPLGLSLTGGATKWPANAARDVFLTPMNVLCSNSAPWPNLHPTDTQRGIAPAATGGKYNSSIISCDDSATTFVTCAVMQCRLLGSIYNSVAGQLTVTFSEGMDRKLEIWNAENQIPIVLKVTSDIPQNDYTWCAASNMCTFCNTPSTPNPADPGYICQGEPVHWYISGLQRWQLFLGKAQIRARFISGDRQPVSILYHQGFWMDARPVSVSAAAAIMWNADTSLVQTWGNQQGVFPDFTNPQACDQSAGQNFDTPSGTNQGITTGPSYDAHCEIPDGSGVNTVHPVIQGVRGVVIVGGAENRPGYARGRSSQLNVYTRW